MTRTLAGPVLLLLACGALGCDTDQPLEVNERNTTINFVGPGAQVPEYLVYQLYEDSEDPNNDGFPDGNDSPDDIDGDGDPDFTSFCVRRLDIVANPISAPWAFSIEIKVLRAADIAPTPIVRAVDDPVFTNPAARNLTAYDTSEDSLSNPRADILAAFNPRNCAEHPSLRCAVDADCAGFPCVDRGTCTGDPAQVCFDLVTNFGQCPQTGPNTLCDCQAIGQGVCCTPELYGLVAGCSASPVDLAGRCTADPTIGCVPSCAQLGVGSCDTSQDAFTRFRFNPVARVLSGVHRDVLRAGSNFINDLDPALVPGTDPPGGLCPGFDLGEPGVLGQGQPFEVQLEKGDTLLVQGRRFDDVPPIYGNGPGLVPLLTAPGVRADLTVDGQRVSPTGSTATGTDASGAINFTFTAR